MLSVRYIYTWSDRFTRYGTERKRLTYIVQKRKINNNNNTIHNIRYSNEEIVPSHILTEISKKEKSHGFQ